MKTPKEPWTRSDKFAAIGVGIAFFSLIVAVFSIPGLRSAFGPTNGIRADTSHTAESLSDSTVNASSTSRNRDEAMKISDSRREAPTLTFCVFFKGEVFTLQGTYNPTTGDTTVMGGIFVSAAYPEKSPPYAVGQRWYQEHDTILVDGDPYEQYGFPRVMLPAGHAARSAVSGVPVLVAMRDIETAPDVVYIPVRRNCEFQPYRRVGYGQ